ncbi:acylphosphatase [Microvirga sp. ACRRW]|uniref:acylphosphatase n=1 Tax=Microvirga sp. ACRRW TaxID=2918205 RepID=UPI001EF739D3|nr:acylphosphatase [Microvirga sp. ACRRW]MCG7394757.1 acylphosphatase [Microvirga sp. ACRRW]
MSTNRVAHVRIHGRVQGVGFRAWTHHQAELHGLKGWVRNRHDGSVEAVFSGPGEMVEVMLKTCHQGPAGSLVQLVEPVEDADPELSDMDGFEVRKSV